MKIDYRPHQGFKLNAKTINWGMDRTTVRQTLGMTYKEDNMVIDVAQFFDGDKSKDIEQRRDIYHFGLFKKRHMILIYDTNDVIRDLEIHSGFNILVNEHIFNFKTELSLIIEKYREEGEDIIMLDEGNYLIPRLNMTLANSGSMGGEGGKLDYFYASADVSHLLK